MFANVQNTDYSTDEDYYNSVSSPPRKRRRTGLNSEILIYDPLKSAIDDVGISRIGYILNSCLDSALNDLRESKLLEAQRSCNYIYTIYVSQSTKSDSNNFISELYKLCIAKTIDQAEYRQLMGMLGVSFKDPQFVSISRNADQNYVQGNISAPPSPTEYWNLKI